jgi:hypothetical protein
MTALRCGRRPRRGPGQFLQPVSAAPGAVPLAAPGNHVGCISGSESPQDRQEQRASSPDSTEKRSPARRFFFRFRHSEFPHVPLANGMIGPFVRRHIPGKGDSSLGGVSPPSLHGPAERNPGGGLRPIRRAPPRRHLARFVFAQHDMRHSGSWFQLAARRSHLLCGRP